MVQTLPEKRGIDLYRIGCAKVAVGELRPLLLRFPDHPVARAWSPVILGRQDHHVVVVHKRDLQGLEQNREVVIKHTPEVDPDRTKYRLVITKELGAPYEKPALVVPMSAAPAEPRDDPPSQEDQAEGDQPDDESSGEDTE